MKNLVTKIALPGAILAFAMVLFGGTAYAFTKWESTAGNQHITETKNYIDELAGRIRKLKEQKSSVDTLLANAETEKNRLATENNTLITEKNRLESELQAKLGTPDMQQRLIDLQRDITTNSNTINQLNDTINRLTGEKNNLLAGQENLIRQKEQAKEQETRNAVETAHEADMNAAVEEMRKLKEHAEQTANDPRHKVD
ncbi:hypothetical protein [Leuconostoc lactis]|uniref:hypothetical protein n=1 Tax=Leuconostoc lactis TaxID=1246 RepID=UPI002898928C|nr:hypothetical protein [Leuconostoc lactis]